MQKVPSIVTWVPYNEGWGQPGADLTRETLRWTRRYDPTRLVNGPSGWNDWEGGNYWKRTMHDWKGGFRNAPKCMDADGKASCDIVDLHSYPGPAMPGAGGGRVSFLGLCTPILVYAGLSVGKDIDAFKRLSWRIVVVGLFVFVGTFMGSAVIAEAVLRYMAK